MAPLPAHVALADELILEPSAHPFGNGPDMRAVTPLDLMLAELALVADDDLLFVRQFRAYIREIGCTLMAHYDREGDVGVSLGLPVDAQVRHRSRWVHFLFESLDGLPSRRTLLLRQLIEERTCWDERPASPRQTTAAIRDFLNAGGCILIDPCGRLKESGCAAAFSLDDPQADGCAAAASRYFATRSRFRADRQIRRAVRLLGRVENGWQVLEARA